MAKKGSLISQIVLCQQTPSRLFSRPLLDWRWIDHLSRSMPRQKLLSRLGNSQISQRWVDTGMLLLLAAVSAGLTFHAGRRGFFAFDQSIVFDGGYRVYLGQIPYRDFMIPVGPVSLWIQALFFTVFSVSYSSYLLHAAVINAVAATVVTLWIALLCPNQKLLAGAGGLLTAIWFYPPFGTPFFDQTAFFFHVCSSTLVVYVCVIEIRNRHEDIVSRTHWIWLLFAGGFAALSFLSKQNAGGLSISFLLAILLLGGRLEWRRRLILTWLFLTGAALVALAFVVWLFLCSDPGTFKEYFFVIPAQEGLSRLTHERFLETLLGQLSFRGAARSTALVAFAISLFFLSSRWRLSRKRPNAELDRGRLAAVTAMTLCLFQFVYAPITNNDPYNTYAFSGIILILCLWLLSQSFALRFSTRWSYVFRTAFWILALTFSARLFHEGWTVATTRRVHDVIEHSSFAKNVSSKALHPVLWAIPTYASWRREVVIEVKDVDRLAAFLAEREEAVLIFPDFTVLYGLTGKTPPQPILWFHQGLTYSGEYSVVLDERIVEEMNSNKVKLVVLESTSFFGTAERLSHFPLLQSYIQQNFSEREQIGIFRVLTKRQR